MDSLEIEKLTLAPEDETRRRLQARAYQLEMLHASIQQNTIVVMGTGTGKTQIAILRIMEELDTGDQNKLVWFLCPTVALCEQQEAAIHCNIPFVRVRSLTSKDNVDHWGDGKLWDAALAGVRVVVSTYQILYDSLAHGFVQFSRLSLLIFDEAHHCHKKSAANKIMSGFYYREKQKSSSQLPRILGLSASPVYSNPSTLEDLESNLNSVCKTPHRFYKELMDFTNRPDIQIRLYPEESPEGDGPFLLRKLQNLIDRRPHAKHLYQFVRTTESVYHALGMWSATNFMHMAIANFKRRARENAEKDWSLRSRTNLTMETICQISSLDTLGPPTGRNDISSKCRYLIDVLLELYGDGFSGLIFVDQRAMVIALKALLNCHPRTKDQFRCGTFVGMSQFRSNLELGDLHDSQTQVETLKKFRNGQLNVIVTTDALEEGIDIPACNAVICFDKPPNLKSFIQRRGRARKGKSGFFILVENDKAMKGQEKIMAQESLLVKEYQDDQRTVQEIRNADGDVLSFEIESTGARLTMHDAVSRLYHFCSRLTNQSFVTNAPLFNYEANTLGSIKATVLLPSNLEPSLHRISGSSWWSSKKNAIADAALQAYKALFHAGLVNQRLLPIRPSDILDQEYFRKSIYNVPPQTIPWDEIARMWDLKKGLYSHKLNVTQPGEESTELIVIIPWRIGSTINFPLYSDHKYTVDVSLSPGVPVDVKDIPLFRRVTSLILNSVCGKSQPPTDTDYVFLLVPDMVPREISTFLENSSGSVSLSEVLSHRSWSAGPGLIRKRSMAGRPRVVKSWPVKEGSATGDCVDIQPRDLHIECLPRRRNFVQPFLKKGEQASPSSDTSFHANCGGLDLDSYTLDRLPWPYVQTALYIPSIIYEIEVHLTAERLQQQLLSDIPFHNLGLLATAIRPSSNVNPRWFQYLAFVGDTIAKFFISKQLFLHHCGWHEGLLSCLKQVVTSDRGLARAAMECNLGEYLVTIQLNGKNWKAPILSNISSSTPPPMGRKVGMSTLSSSVKAIIGATYVDSGIGNAATCAAKIIPPFKSWHASSLYDGSYMHTRPVYKEPQVFGHGEVENLLGYKFEDRSLLLEALTHPSCSGTGRTTSYRRLAFMGAGVLDMVVLDYMHRQNDQRSAERCHILKSAVTNNMFLSFVCSDFHHDIECDDVDATDRKGIRTIKVTRRMHLWNYLRANNQQLLEKLHDTSQASYETRLRIKYGLIWEKVYPWKDLQALDYPPVLSDIVQSIFGAVFIDSGAELQHCHHLAQKIGILPLLGRLIRDGVLTGHPGSCSQTLADNRRQVKR